VGGGGGGSSSIGVAAAVVDVGRWVYAHMTGAGERERSQKSDNAAACQTSVVAAGELEGDMAIRLTGWLCDVGEGRDVLCGRHCCCE